MSEKICPKRGSRIPDGERVCPQCGTSVALPEASGSMEGGDRVLTSAHLMFGAERPDPRPDPTPLPQPPIPAPVPEPEPEPVPWSQGGAWWVGRRRLLALGRRSSTRSSLRSKPSGRLSASSRRAMRREIGEATGGMGEGKPVPGG